MKSAIYALVNILTFGRGCKRKISGFELRLPWRYSRYFEAVYELNNINFINNYVKPGMAVIDVGAHIGLLTTVMAQKVAGTGRVFSFEPTPSTYSLLKTTIRLNKLNSVVWPIQAAVSDKNGSTYFYVSDIEAHNSNSLSNNRRQAVTEKPIEVKLISLDNLKNDEGITTVDFIKIDAEGAEYSVLKGANSIIDTDRPIMILALHPASIANFGDSLSQIWDFIASKQYKVQYMHDLLDKESFCAKTDLFDVFLLPQ